MLIDILRMPNVFGLPIDRRMTIYAGTQPPPHVEHPMVYWPSVPLQSAQLHVGSLVSKFPQNLFKAIHLSYDSRWIFESVFSLENTLTPCLYTKMISAQEINLAISMKAIEYYHSEMVALSPLSRFIAPIPAVMTSDITDLVLSAHTSVDTIVPPIFGDMMVWKAINRYREIMERHRGSLDPHYRSLGWEYSSLYDYEPSIFEALLDGCFRRDPFMELRSPQTWLEIMRDKWFNYQELSHSMHARGMITHINHPDFDLIVLGMIGLLPSKFNLCAQIYTVIEELPAMYTTRDHYNPYYPVLKGIMLADDRRQFDLKVGKIFYESAMAYCRLYSIDSQVFLEDSFNRSSITISKNIYDEVTIIVHDVLHDRYVSFYTSFPALALTTQSVGWS